MLGLFSASLRALEDVEFERPLGELAHGLVFHLLRRITGYVPGAWVGAMAFALHPVQVESVGWISGMKDLLCWVFMIGALLLYVKREMRSDQASSLWRGKEMLRAWCDRCGPSIPPRAPGPH